MPRKKECTIKQVRALLEQPDAPDNISDIARLLGYTRTNPLQALLKTPTREAPKGYKIVFVPQLVSIVN